MSSKRLATCNGLHGVVSPKTTFRDITSPPRRTFGLMMLKKDHPLCRLTSIYFDDDL
jgi:hypothetical protein